MKKEFTRYGLPQYRILTGALQVMGSTGMLVGFFFEPLGLISALGLSLLMLLGVVVRIKIQDPVIAVLPAIVFMCLNGLIFLMSLQIVEDLPLAF